LARIGSLVARIIFQPVEEISRLYFSKTLSVCTISEAQAEVKDGADSASQEGKKDPLQKELERRSAKTKTGSSDIVSTKPLTETQKSALRQASETLHTLLLVQSHLLLILLTFLPPYLPTLLSHFLPKGYLTTSAPAVLQAYAYYLPTMSLNGLLEAFAFSVMSPYEFRDQTRMLFVASVIFGISVWIFCDRLEFGEVGLVMANVGSLGVRAAWAAWFSDRWFKRMWSREAQTEANSSDSQAVKPLVKETKGISLVQILPPFTVILCFAISSQLVRFSQRHFNLGEDTILLQRNLKDRDMLKAQIQHIIIGGICGLVCLLECYRSQKGHVKTLISLARSKSSASS
jgi:oligosaccharide translocation protein RFT1